MKLLLLSCFGLATLTVSSAPTLDLIQAELAKLNAMIEERAKAMREVMELGGSWDKIPGAPEAPEAEEKPVGGVDSRKLQPASGLSTGGLSTGSLSSKGVQSGAKGLTPDTEWRRMFPTPINEVNRR